MATTTEDWSVPVQEQEVRDLDARYRSLPSGEQKKAAKAEYKAALNTLFEDQAENLVVRNYKQAKQYFPGYTYVPPVHWDVPQRHISICRPNGPNVRKFGTF